MAQQTRQLEVIQTDKAAAPIGPYSQAVRAGDFNAMNAVYAEYFTSNPPGRTTVGVQALPANAQVEITVTALA